MNVLTIIPARSGSRRCPGKNWEKVGGKTLLQRALDCLPETSAEMDVAIVSDAPKRCPKEEHDHEIHVLKEPKRLAADTMPMRNVVSWACEQMYQETYMYYDAVLLLQPSSPLRDRYDVGKCISFLELNENVDSVVSVVADLKTKGYRRNGAIYLTRWEYAVAGELMGGITQFYVMPPERSIDIDTPEDLAEARRLAGDTQEPEPRTPFERGEQFNV